MTRAGAALGLGLIVGLAGQPTFAEEIAEPGKEANAERMALEALLDSHSLALTIDLESRVERSTAEQVTRATREQMAMLAERAKRSRARSEVTHESSGPAAPVSR